VVQAVGVAAVCGPLLFIGLHAVNRLTDGTPAADEQAKVVEVFMGRSSAIDVERTGRAGTWRLSGLGNTTRVGDAVILHVHSGRLGWEWSAPPERP